MKRRTLKDIDAILGPRRVAAANAVARRKMKQITADRSPQKMKKKKSKWSAYFHPDGSVDFDAMPESVKLAFIAEGERGPWRPLTRAQRREFEAWRRCRLGRNIPRQ
jgi:hypothetical protein